MGKAFYPQPVEAFRNPEEPIEEAVDLTPEELTEPEIKATAARV